MLDNSFFNRFDRSSFKSFYAAANELNFTKAARKSGITQSGISQHIAKLEAELETTLFLRLKNGLALTDTGKVLMNYLEKIYQEEEKLLELLSKEEKSLQGSVKYSMPGSCLMSPHFNMMLEIKKNDFSLVDLTVDIFDSETVVEKVLSGTSDFGFITRDIEHPQVEKIEFCQENYILIGGRENKVSKDKLASLPFIEHPDFDSLFNIWFKAQFPRKRAFSSKKLNFTGSTNRIAAALSMVSGNLGYTVLPEHCAAELLSDKRIEVVKEFKPAVGTIHIIYRKDLTLPKRVKTVINTFLGFYNKSFDD